MLKGGRPEKIKCETSASEKDQAILEVLTKVLEERSAKNLNKFANKVKKSREKYDKLNLIEDRSYTKLKPNN